jgi:pimeloyl-ACP methyl ester carboxylesterase
MRKAIYKKIICIGFLFLISGLCDGQELIMDNKFYFLPVIKVSKHTGKNFRYTVDYKAEPSDTISNLTLFGLQIGKSDYDFGTANTPVEKNKKNEWATCVIAGKIDDRTEKIWFYKSIAGNGTFYFDNLSMEIQNNDGSWVNIFKDDFEMDKKEGELLNNYQISDIKNGTYRVSRVKESKDNTFSVKIITNNGKPKTVVNYGSNKRVGKFYNIHGIRIYTETYGQGEPLLLLHGNGQSIKNFKAQIKEFSKTYQVIAVDTRGQGKSIDTLTQYFSYELFANDMVELLDSMNLKKVNLLGWSDGGNTGLLIAIKYPEYINKLILMGANLFPTKEAISEKLLKTIEDDIDKLKKAKTSDGMVKQRLLQMLIIEPNIRPTELAKIRSKTLVLAGEKDLIKQEHTELIAKSILRAEKHIFKKGTHFIPEEDPKSFNSIVLTFLKSN